MEEWKWIKDYEGEYQISSFGRIKSFKKNKKNGLLMKPKRDGQNRYYIICLSKNGISNYYLIHRLVAQTFLPNPNNLPQVNHIDGNKKNNKLENLEWVTCSENITHAYKLKLNSKGTSIYIIDVFTGKIIEECYSINLASKITGLDDVTIRGILNGDCGTYGKFTFIETDEENLEEEIKNKLRRTYVIQMIDKNTNEVIKEFCNHLEAKQFMNITSNAIHNCLQGISKTALGYKWRYKYR